MAMHPIRMSGLLRPSPGPEARAWAAACTVKPSAARLSQLDRLLIRPLKRTGVWSLLECLFVLAAHDAQAGRVDLKNPSRVATEHGAPTFVADRGYDFNGTSSYLNSTFTPSSQATHMTGTSGCHGCYSRTDVAHNGSAYGSLNSSTQNLGMFPRTTGGNVEAALNHAGSAAAKAVADSLGLFVYQRVGNQVEQFKRGVSLGTATLTTSGSTLTTLPQFIGARNQGGSPIAYRPFSCGAFLIGGALSGSQQESLAAALQAYLVAIGAAV